jgi:hypothetical protein
MLDILAQLIKDAEANPTKSHEAYALDVFDVMQNDAKVGRMWVRVNGVQKQIMLERISVADDITTREENVRFLCAGYPLYHAAITKGLPHRWTCIIEDIWGYGVPIHQMHICSMRLIRQWASLSRDDFIKNVQQRFIDWGAEVQNGVEEEYKLCVEAMADAACARYSYSYRLAQGSPENIASDRCGALATADAHWVYAAVRTPVVTSVPNQVLYSTEL